MIAVITGDIINSRKIEKASIWLEPLKKQLSAWGESPEIWEIYRGDSFQLKVQQPEKALWHALCIKALIKSIVLTAAEERSGRVDVRMAIGIGEEGFKAKRITESNGEAFIRSGDQFEKLQSDKVNLSIQSPWPDQDVDTNLKIRLGLMVMDNWSANSAQLMHIILQQPNLKQTEISRILGIEQNSVSGRFSRAYANEILALEHNFREQVKKQLP
jgi:predicted XRE-type DNA-binding protein